MSADDHKLSSATLPKRSVLTLAMLFIAAAAGFAAWQWLEIGFLGEFRLVLPVLAAFLAVSTIEWIKDGIEAGRHKP